MEQTNFSFGAKYQGDPLSQGKWENYDNVDFDQFLQQDGHLNLNSNFPNTETTPLSLKMEMSLGCDGNMHQNNRSAMNMMNPFDSASVGSSAFRLGHALAQNHSGNAHSYTPSTNSIFSHQSIDPVLFQNPPGLDLSLPNLVSSDLPNPTWDPAMYGNSMGNATFESLDRELFGCDAALSGMFSPSPSPSPVKPNLLANTARTNEGTVEDILEDILSLAAPVSESSLRAEAPPDPVTPTRPRSNKRTRSSKNANPDIAPATPVAVGSGSLLTPPKSGKSASPATKRRKCNTPSKTPNSTPKKPRKVTTKSTPKKAPKRKAPEHDIDKDGDSQPEPELKTEPQLSPEEILGFSWNYVQQMQLQDQGLALTKYQSLEEANAAQWDLQLEAIPDVTIPTTIHEKKVLVNLIIGASRDVTVATDGERVMTPWRNNSYSREQLERGAWALLEAIILAQKSNAKVKGGVKGKARFASFGERFLRALSYLKVSKNISRRIVYAGRWIPLADNPAEVFKSVGINSNVNRKKAAHIAAGKAVAAAEAEAEEEEETEDEDEEPIEPTDDTTTSAPKRPAQDSCDQAVEKKRRVKR